jgi:histone acetyltransferase (RNA polymerase elongator complex component)
MKRLIVPIFVPNLGCPHRCIFCDQRAISGAEARLPTREEMLQTADLYLGSNKARRLPLRQLAFYGGTFTLLPEADQDFLLGVGRELMAEGRVESLRLSTRPDAVDAACLARLAASGVRTVELGAQSFDDRVLSAAGRGHGAADTIAAAGLIKEAGIEGGLELGLQLMCGLPGEDEESFLASCLSAANLAPDLVRLYPVLVLEGTTLAALWRRGGYRPLTLEEAVHRCRQALELFEARAIAVARMGLQASPGLEAAWLAGPYHPAFGQLVRTAARPGRKTNSNENDAAPPLRPAAGRLHIRRIF